MNTESNIKEIGVDDLSEFFLSLDITNDGAWDLDMENDRLYLSSNALKMLGYEKSKINGSGVSCNEFFHEDFAQAVQNEFVQVVKGQTDVIDIESKVRLMPKGWKRIRIRGKVISRDKKRSKVRLIGVFHDVSDHKLTKENWKGCPKEFKTLFDNFAIGIAVNSPDNSVIEVNHLLCQMLGYQRDEILMKPCNEFVYSGDSNKVSDLISDVFEGKIESFSTDVRLVRKDGTFIYTTLSTICFKDEFGHVHHFISTVVNTSELHEIKERIKLDQYIQRTIINSLPISVYLIDKDGRKAMSNKTDWEIIGFNSEAEVLGKTDIELFPEKIGEQCHADNMYVINNNVSILNKEEVFIDKDGNQKWLMTSKIPIPSFKINNQPSGLIGIGVDITEQKRLLQQVRDSENYYKSLVSNSPKGIIVTDLSGKVTLASKKIYEIFRIPDNDDLVGELIFDWVTPENIQEATLDFNDFIEGNRSTEAKEYKCIKYDESEFWAEFAGSPLHDTSKNIIGVMFVCRDKSDWKRIENDLLSEKNKAIESDKLKTALLRVVSHEVRTPLNGIIGYSNLLGEPGLSDKMIRSYVNNIQVSSDHLLSVITDLIDISSIEGKIVKLNKSQVDLNQLIKDIGNQYQLKAKAKNLKLIISQGVPDEHLILTTDKTKLVQIISNLLNNAFKFTLSGKVEFGYTYNESEVVFYVSDTGIGIPPNYHSKIFESLFQVENELIGEIDGIGLGLSICKAYVELLNGTIRVDSELGKGSTFSFTIPINPDDSSPLTQIIELNSDYQNES